MLLTSKNIAANIVALEFGAVQKASIGTSSLGGGVIVAAVEILFLLPAALAVVLGVDIGAMAVPLGVIVFASKGDCGGGGGEEDDGEGLDGNHFDFGVWWRRKLLKVEE